MTVLLATLLPFAAAQLDYLVPVGTKEGAVVIVPLGSRKVPWVVLGLSADGFDRPGSNAATMLSTRRLFPKSSGNGSPVLPPGQWPIPGRC